MISYDHRGADTGGGTPTPTDVVHQVSELTMLSAAISR